LVDYANFTGYNLTVQGDGGITYAGTITVQAESHRTQRLLST